MFEVLFIEFLLLFLVAQYQSVRLIVRYRFPAHRRTPVHTQSAGRFSRGGHTHIETFALKQYFYLVCRFRNFLKKSAVKIAYFPIFSFKKVGYHKFLAQQSRAYYV